MFYTIYKVTNKLNGKFYIGKHQTTKVNDAYYGSGKAIKEAIQKYGVENFDKEVLYVFDNEDDMNLKEKELITEEFVNRNDTYNLGVGGEGGAHFKGKTHSPETIEQIKQKRAKQTFSSETRRKISEANKGRTVSEPTRQLHSTNGKARVGKPHSEETKLKIAEAIRQKRKMARGSVTVT
jgi:group I intron endonuclease